MGASRDDSDFTPAAHWGKPSPFHDPRLLARFRARGDDVLITTAPKAGTTWMQQILYQLRSGGDDTFSCIYDVVPWLERPRRDMSWRAQLAAYERLPTPRIFKTHCTHEQTPAPGQVRIVLTSRDPRDCCVSFYHHLMEMTPQALARAGIVRPRSFDEYFERWLAAGVWFRNVSSWWPHRRDANVLWLRYEDLKQDLPAALERIAAFLRWPWPAATRERVLNHCSFAWMKANAARFARFPEDREPLFRPGGFIRRGAVGAYDELMSAAQAERILARARARLAPDCLAFLGLPA